MDVGPATGRGGSGESGGELWAQAGKAKATANASVAARRHFMDMLSFERRLRIPGPYAYIITPVAGALLTLRLDADWARAVPGGLPPVAVRAVEGGLSARAELQFRRPTERG